MVRAVGINASRRKTVPYCSLRGRCGLGRRVYDFNLALRLTQGARRRLSAFGWAMRETLHAELVVTGWLMAVQRQHSDRGVQLGFNRSSQHHLATSFVAASKASAGVRQPSVFRGRALSAAATCRQLLWTVCAYNRLIKPMDIVAFAQTSFNESGAICLL